MTADRVEVIRKRLTETFRPEQLEIIDESHKHAGHASAGGAGHFFVQLVSDAFEGKNAVQRHRMVYDALGELIGPEIHALSIQAKTPSEIQQP